VSTLLDALGMTVPIVAAPMAGGPTTPALAAAGGAAGGIGFLAAGYKTADLLAEQIAAVRSTGVAFGVNLFAPNPVPVDPAAFRAYAQRLQADGDRYGLDLAHAEPREDDDQWDEKIALLLADPVPVVSFTFGIPGARVIEALHARETVLVQTVTSAAEAVAAAEAGVDVLAVQASAAGGHSGTLTPAQLPPPTPITELVAQVRAVTTLPVIAAGGLATSADIGAVLHAGAFAAAVGTVLLLSDESGASAPYQSAIAQPGERRTLVTRAFSGRPARGLSNEFTDRYDEGAPPGYPAIHHLTTPLRRAAAAASDPERINLWAGTGYQHAQRGPATAILEGLAQGL
jgi:NAD(P)H-dependent flavin oxidoreductase YrpB (nitropropane dioxygenase family)